MRIATAGGHANTVRVDTEDATDHVDTGFIVFNDRNYPNFERLPASLHVAAQPCDMSFGVSEGGDFEYNGASPNGLFAKRAHLLTWRSRRRPAQDRGRRGRLALGGTIAHPERMPYGAALQLVRTYADAPGFDAANAAMRAGTFPRLAEIDVPLTFAWPEYDRLVARPRSVPAFAREFRLDGCGHMPTWDDPEQVARVLLAGGALAPRDVELAADQDRDAG